MKINVKQEWLKSLKPCEDGYKYWVEQNKTNLFEFIHQCKKDNHLNWANWLIVRCMDRKQRLAYAIFAAEQALHIFENKYPDDNRPRKAIEAAREVLKRDSTANRAAAADAAVAAADAADAVYIDDAAAAAAAAAAADAAYAAAADAASDAADAAVAAAAYAADALWNILKNGMKILESEG